MEKSDSSKLTDMETGGVLETGGGVKAGRGSWDGVERRKMSRYLSEIDVLAIAFGCIIGWGAFVMPGTTFLPIAGPGGTVIAMAVSAFIMIIIGMNYAYLMIRKPRTGGVYSFTKEAFGRDHAFLCSWFLSLSYISIVFLNATALFIVGRTMFGSMLQVGMHYQVAGYDIYMGEVAVSTLALIVIGLLFILHKPVLQKIQTALAIILLAGAVIITAVCLPQLDPELIFSDFGMNNHHEVAVVLTIVLLSPWAFVGFDVISLETAHFKFPVRKSGKLIVISIILGGFVYVAMSLVSITSVPDGYLTWQEYVADLDDLSGVATVPTFYAAKSILGDFGLAVIGITAITAILTGIIGAYRATTRVLSTMAEDKIVSEKFSSTSFCIMFIMLISIAVSLLGRNALEWFVELTTFGAIIGFGYTSASAYKLSRKEHNLKVTVTSVLGTIMTGLFAIVQMIPKVTMLETMGAESFLLLAIWCLLGFVFYWRTMIHSSLSDYNGASTSSTVLFSLLLYCVMMWFFMRIMKIVTSDEMQTVIFRYGLILMIIVFIGLMVMLYVQNLLRQRHTELEREIVRAEESSKAKSQFLFNMSHDIRTPMNAIIGFTNLALSKDATPEQKNEYLAKISNSGQQLLAIINDVLDMSRIESGKMELYPVPTDLDVVLGDFRDMFAAQMEEKGISYSVISDSIEDNWILCDKNRLDRIILNLIGNAYKFTPEGGKIQVTLSQTGKDEKTADYVLRVKDSGIGMSKEFADNMFTPFERERTSTVSGIQGTGLGLAIVKNLVELMGGSIDVVTAPGKGTEFIVDFSFETTEPSQDNHADSTSHDFDFAGTRVLLADDNEVNREIAVMILENAGISVDTVENGEQAVEKVAVSSPCAYDAVLMDVQMPVMNGYEATRKIRALDDDTCANVPVIAMTANVFKEDEIEAEKAGMQGHIAKPLDIDKMMGTLAKVLKTNRNDFDEQDESHGKE